jgi:hypothetical protein
MLTFIVVAPTSTIAIRPCRYRKLALHELKGGLAGEYVNIHNHRIETGHLCCRDAVFDLLLARGGDHHLDFLWIIRCRADHLKVKVDLVKGKRDILICLGFDLQLEILLALPGGDLDFLGNNRRVR